MANWLIGQEIIEEEQKGQAKAGYGERLLRDISAQLKTEFGNGYSVDNLELFRRFYQTYPDLISDAVSRKLGAGEISDAVRRKSAIEPDLPALISPEPWQPGRLHPNLRGHLAGQMSGRHIPVEDSQTGCGAFALLRELRSVSRLVRLHATTWTGWSPTACDLALAEVGPIADLIDKLRARAQGAAGRPSAG